MAFINYCRKNMLESQSLLEELFSAPSSKNQVDSLMDRTVLELSLKVIDDYPASDPRWTDSVPTGHESTFATVSLLVLHQLDDKKKAHDLFLTFLRSVLGQSFADLCLCYYYFLLQSDLGVERIDGRAGSAGL